MGARERCAWLTILTIWESRVSAPTRSARMTKPPVPLTVPPVTLRCDILLDGNGLAADHGLVDGTVALEHDAIDGDLFARPDPQPVAYLNLIERHIGFAALSVEPSCRLGSEAEQRTDGTAGLTAGA